ncbi:hypothetical protein GALMADRAFT_144382 [Galerina marginata CBS 339.88]|uniref:Uncharacterized protein n=1 Tax=Galerina marginata (strain CBS 339.88) TaxID=685588 RepID=A0A067SLM6_GALM3|nr:hypothetical protein GALMADRAFT_144382 [Galerina marginata CBS 339.88]
MSSFPQTPSRRGRSAASTPSPASTATLSPPSSPRSPSTASRIRTEVVTTSTRTRNIRHGLEVTTKTRTVTTFTRGDQDSGPLEPPPSPSPPPRNRNQTRIDPDIPTVTIYLPRSPSSLVYFHAAKYYVLTGGEDAGVFKDWQVIYFSISPSKVLSHFVYRDQVKLRTQNLSFRIFETRTDWEDAVAIYTIAFNEGSILLEPNPNGQFRSANTAIQRQIRTGDLPPPLRNGIPEPRSLQRPFSLGKFYVVFKGEEVGVWGIWHQAAARTVKVNGFCSKYNSWTEALKAYEDAFKAHKLRVLSRVGGPFSVCH